MWRGILFFIKLGVLVALAVWLAEQPGTVAIDWLGYRVETTVGLLILAVALVTVVLGLVYRFYRGLRRAPAEIGRSLGGSRRKRGYKALTNGMVAVAAGDAREAARWSKKANHLLDEPPLTRLLAAQTAQLNGDDQAARKYFTEMLESGETRFLALRGLVMQALHDGDEETARRYLREAQALRPQTPWVVTHLFEMSEKAGDLDTAETTLREAERHKLLPRPEAQRKRAVVLLERAMEADKAQRRDAALSDAREANKLAPGLIPATVLLARLHIDADQPRRAARLLERAWTENPHPDIAAAFMALNDKETAIDRMKRLDRLVSGNAGHPESRLAMARAALNAQLWGEARRHLAPLTGDTPEQRACRLMAEIEERENGDRAAAVSWLHRAEKAEPAATWVCGGCGAVATDWSAHCGACNAFDSVEWRRPTRVVPQIERPRPVPAPPRIEEGAGKTPPTIDVDVEDTGENRKSAE
jgi:HemY protein